MCRPQRRNRLEITSMPRIDPEKRDHPADWIQAALTGIGTATIVTDARSRVRFMNSVAESLTGWPQSEAAGKRLVDVFRIEDEQTRETVIDPVAVVIASNEVVGTANHIVLIARNGTEWHLDDSAAPVRDEFGAIVAVVLVFRDVTGRRRAERAVEEALAFAEGIIETVREPLLVLEANLIVRLANRAFYRTFGVPASETIGRLVFDLGNRQWNIPRLRELLEEILPRDSQFDDFEVDHTFNRLGRRRMTLNARRLEVGGNRPALILLAVEDATDRLWAVEALSLSEIRYRRLFETAQDGILLVDPKTRKIFDANPFLTALLGYHRDELVGKELFEIGLFHDIPSNKAAFQTLQETGYIRYENLPLRTRDARSIEVEFVSNVYDVGDTQVIQCNIRDVTDRKRAEDAVQAARAELETRVGERTAELAFANAELQEEIARRELAEADRRDLQQKLTTAQEDERRRIARELHDQMGQHLTALGLGLKLVRDATPDSSPASARLQNLQTLTDMIGRDVHHLALELRPTALDDLGLRAALMHYAEKWSERSGIEVDFQAAKLDSSRLPPPVETALYRVVQEALTNVLKHSQARRVSLVLQRSPDHVSAVIEDNGRGFDVESGSQPAATANRLGILGMRERVALVGGNLTVESSLEHGTTIIARVPLSTTPRETRDG